MNTTNNFSTARSVAQTDGDRGRTNLLELTSEEILNLIESVSANLSETVDPLLARLADLYHYSRGSASQTATTARIATIA